MDFDALRAAVVPGAGVVGRWPGVVCVAECADRHVLRQLLDVCANAAAPSPAGPWRAGSRCGWAARTRPVTGCASAPWPSPGRPALRRAARRAVGGVPLRVGRPRRAGPAGGVLGRAVRASTDRLLPRPDAPVVLALEGGPIPPGWSTGARPARRRRPGAGAVLVPSGDHASAAAATSRARTRPADSRWFVVGARTLGPPVGRRARVPRRPPRPPRGSIPDDSHGNGMPSRGSLGALTATTPATPGDTGAERSSGRPHLRPVPTGSNGVAHRGWVPRRGSAVDLDRYPDTVQGRCRRTGGGRPGRRRSTGPYRAPG